MLSPYLFLQGIYGNFYLVFAHQPHPDQLIFVFDCYMQGSIQRKAITRSFYPHYAVPLISSPETSHNTAHSLQETISIF